MTGVAAILVRCTYVYFIDYVATCIYFILRKEIVFILFQLPQEKIIVSRERYSTSNGYENGDDVQENKIVDVEEFEITTVSMVYDVGGIVVAYRHFCPFCKDVHLVQHRQVERRECDHSARAY